MGTSSYKLIKAAIGDTVSNFWLDKVWYRDSIDEAMTAAVLAMLSLSCMVNWQLTSRYG